jgi:hypothetical protein
MKAKEFIPASKPRNPVVRQQQTSGAGSHRDKKKEQNQGYKKHKGKEVEESVEDYADMYSPEAVKLAKKFVDHYEITDDTDIQLTVELIDLYLEDFKEKNIPIDIKLIKSKLANSFRQVYRGMGGGPSFKKSFKEQGMDERVRDPEDWDEGNTEPPNNFAVYINGKKWKVFKGRGQFADDYKEMQHFRQLQNWAQQKSSQTGKKWEVYKTGETATEGIEEANVNPQFIIAQVTKILAGEARRMTNAPMAQLLAPVMKEYGLTLQQIDAMIPGGLKKAAGEYGIMMKEGESAREKWNRASAEREKKHNDAEKEMKARHASGKEDMKGAIDRLEKHLDKK